MVMYVIQQTHHNRQNLGLPMHLGTANRWCCPAWKRWFSYQCTSGDAPVKRRRFDSTWPLLPLKASAFLAKDDQIITWYAGGFAIYKFPSISTPHLGEHSIEQRPNQVLFWYPNGSSLCSVILLPIFCDIHFFQTDYWLLLDINSYYWLSIIIETYYW